MSVSMPASPTRRFPRSPARLTPTPMPDGSVRQLGENSEDGGRTWTVLYDLTYRRRK